MTPNYKTTMALAIGLLILISVIGLALGQGGTGRTNTNATSPKKTTPKKATTPAKRRSNSGNSASTDEIAYWNTIKNSTDPEDFKAYLQQYPTGKFVALARNRLKSLEAAQPKPVATPAATDTSPANKTPSSTLSSPRTISNGYGIEFVLIPPGNFMMGSTNGKADEKPVHQVTISYSFYLGRHEVTQAQWQSVMADNPSYFKECGGNCPVESVSWNDVQDFVNKLNEANDGFKYRLPSEAEWEYAYRGGSKADYYAQVFEIGWYADNSGKKTHPVGKNRPNAFGLYDMPGNVWEWCGDWYHPSYDGAPTDGSAWERGGDQQLRVVRGGSWNDDASFLRSAHRYQVTADLRSVVPAGFGFRVVAVARTSTNSSSTSPTSLTADPVLTPPDTRNLPSGDPKSQTAAEPPTEKVFRVSEVDQRAQVLEKPPPSYTEEARKNQVTGTVVLRAVLSSTGQVTNITVVRGLPDGLTERAIAAAKKLKFKPAMKDGKPVSQHVQLEYNLNLY